MTYTTYQVKAWFGNSMITHNVVAISIAAALADIEDAYGETPDHYQVSVIED